MTDFVEKFRNIRITTQTVMVYFSKILNKEAFIEHYPDMIGTFGKSASLNTKIGSQKVSAIIFCRCLRLPGMKDNMAQNVAFEIIRQLRERALKAGFDLFSDGSDDVNLLIVETMTIKNHHISEGGDCMIDIPKFVSLLENTHLENVTSIVYDPHTVPNMGIIFNIPNLKKYYTLMELENNPTNGSYKTILTKMESNNISKFSEMGFNVKSIAKNNTKLGIVTITIPKKGGVSISGRHHKAEEKAFSLVLSLIEKYGDEIKFVPHSNQFTFRFHLK